MSVHEKGFHRMMLHSFQEAVHNQAQLGRGTSTPVKTKPVKTKAFHWKRLRLYKSKPVHRSGQIIKGGVKNQTQERFSPPC